MTEPQSTKPASKLVRLEQARAEILDRIAAQESRTQVAQLGLIFDAGIKAMGFAPAEQPTPA